MFYIISCILSIYSSDKPAFRRVFKDLGLVEYLGSGMPRILKAYPRTAYTFSTHFIRTAFPISKEALALEKEVTGEQATGKGSEKTREKTREKNPHRARYHVATFSCLSYWHPEYDFYSIIISRSYHGLVATQNLQIDSITGTSARTPPTVAIAAPDSGRIPKISVIVLEHISCSQACFNKHEH